MRNIWIAAAALAVGFGVGACKSGEEPGVKTNYRTQWTTVDADTKEATELARAVLEGEGLKEVRAESTNVDGKASGKMADGTKVNVSVKKQAADSSQVSVNVGTLGDPDLGAEIARKIKDRAASGEAATASDTSATTRPANAR
jgi:hypothetical protein